MNFPKFYSPSQVAAWQLLASNNLPAKGSGDDTSLIPAEDGLSRDLYLQWSKLPTEGSDRKPISIHRIFCDVLDLDEDFLVSDGAFIFARRIEVSNKAGFILDRSEGNMQALQIFAQEVVDKGTGLPTPLPVAAVFEGGKVVPHEFRPDGANSPASGFLWEDEASKPTAFSPGDLDPSWLIEGQALRLSLVTLFQVATLISPEHPKLGVSQLRWISALAHTSSETRDLANEAVSMALTILTTKAATDQGALLVPQLDLELYADRADAMMGLLRHRQEQLERYRILMESDDQWELQAESVLESHENDLDLSEKLLKQAEDTRFQTVQARNIAAHQVTIEQAAVVEKKFAFDAGIQIWKHKETRSATVDMIFGIVQILEQIPAIVTGVGALETLPAIKSGLSAAQFIAKGSEKILSAVGQGKKKAPDASDDDDDDDAVIANFFDDDFDASKHFKPKPVSDPAAEKEAAKKAEKIQGELVSGLTKAGAGGQQVFDAAMKIVNVAAQAKRLEQTSTGVLQQTDSTVDKAFSTFSAEGLDLITGGKQDWDIFSEAIDSTFTNIKILGEIEGGTAYKLELRNLIVYGHALSETRLAMAKANAQLAEAKIRRISAEKAVQIAKERVKVLLKKKKADHVTSQFMVGRVIEAKRGIYLAMEAHRRAFEYFTLADPSNIPALPRLTSTVDDFALAVAKISGRDLQLSTLIRFSGSPQDMNTSFLLDDPEIIGSLRKSGWANFRIPQSTQAFEGFGRVRFVRVRMFAVGLETTEKVQIQIATSGFHVDKVPRERKKTRRFVSPPVGVNFVYRGANPDQKPYPFDGGIARRYVDSFFQPTPFTVWTVHVGPQSSRASLDLSRITHLKIEFSGEAVPM